MARKNLQGMVMMSKSQAAWHVERGGAVGIMVTGTSEHSKQYYLTDAQHRTVGRVSKRIMQWCNTEHLSHKYLIHYHKIIAWYDDSISNTGCTGSGNLAGIV